MKRTTKSKKKIARKKRRANAGLQMVKDHLQGIVRTKPMPKRKTTKAEPPPPATSAVTMTEPGAGLCFKCRKPAGPEMYCFGCKAHVCEKCDVACGNYGPGHSKEAHLVYPPDAQ